MDEFKVLYEHWLQSYMITDISATYSSKDINEVFTLFLILEQGPEFQVGITEKLECMLEILNLQYFGLVQVRFSLTPDWNAEAEVLFGRIDEDKKGYLDAEGLQFVALALIMPELKFLEPIMLRKQTNDLLKEMRHTNGIVSMKCFKNYLIHKAWTSLQDLKVFSDKLQTIFDIWRQVRAKILRREIDELSQCTFLGGNKQDLPSIWNQAIMLSISNTVKSK
jgi:hypothetical protein